MYLFYCLIFLIFCPLDSSEISWKSPVQDKVSANIIISNNELSLDDELKVSLLLKYPSNMDIDVGEIESNLLQGFNSLSTHFFLASKEVSEPIINDGIVTREIHFSLDPMSSGTYLLSFLNIHFKPKNKNEKTVEIFTDVFEIRVKNGVNSVELMGSLNPPLPHSNAPPMNLSTENANVFSQQNQNPEKNIKAFESKSLPLKLFLIGCVLALIGYFLRDNALKVWEKWLAVVPPTPKEKALVHLDVLQKIELAQKGEYESFYVDLTNTIRQYIEDQFHLRAPHYTTEEFLLKAKESNIFDEHSKKNLEGFLENADKVKFAEYQPSLYDCEKALEMAKKFIS